MAAPEYIMSPALTVNGTAYDIIDGSWKFDPDLEEILSTTSFFPAYTLGNMKASITVKTKDKALANTFYKGIEATDVALLFKRAPLTPATEQEAHTFASGTLGWTISNARVTEGLDFAGSADKKVSEFTITFTAARKSSDNSDPTLTRATS